MKNLILAVLMFCFCGVVSAQYQPYQGRYHFHQYERRYVPPVYRYNPQIQVYPRYYYPQYRAYPYGGHYHYYSRPYGHFHYHYGY